MQDIHVNIFKNNNLWDKVVLSVSPELATMLKTLQKTYNFDNFHSAIDVCWNYYKKNFGYPLNTLIVAFLNIDRHLSDTDEIVIQIQ